MLSALSRSECVGTGVARWDSVIRRGTWFCVISSFLEFVGRCGTPSKLRWGPSRRCSGV